MYLAFTAEGSAYFLQLANIFKFANRQGNIMLNRLFHFFMKCGAELENRQHDACLAQFDSFWDGCNSKPVDANVFSHA